MKILINKADEDLLTDFRWRVNPRGYAVTKVPTGRRGGKNVLLHRLILERILGRPIKANLVTDHKNRDRLDNRRSNLREVTQGVNARNRRATRIARADGSQWWRVYFMVNGKKRMISSLTHDEAVEIAAELDEAIQGDSDPLEIVAKYRRSRQQRTDCVSGIRHVAYRPSKNGYRARVRGRYGPKRGSADEAADDAAIIRAEMGAA